MLGVQSARIHKQTSPLREWLALFTSTAWYFSTYQSYDPVLHSSDMNMFWFSVVFALPIILLSLIFSNNIKTVSQIARCTTPFGIAITILMPLFPDSWFVALFILSGPFIAPLAIRCCYGVVQSAKPNKRLQTFMSAITSAIFIHAAWLLVVQSLKLTSFMHFLFPAVMALISYMLTYRNPPEYIVPVHIVSLSLTKHIFYVIFVLI